MINIWDYNIYIGISFQIYTIDTQSFKNWPEHWLISVTPCTEELAFCNVCQNDNVCKMKVIKKTTLI